MPEITPEYLASQGLSQTFPQRFLSKFQISDGCWNWVSGKNEHGYGIIGKGRRGDGFIKSHRASWIFFMGPIPKGRCVLHRCDNPPCVRPDHLFIGTKMDNLKDASNKGRVRRGDKHWNTKISDQKVIELRRIYKKYAKNQQQIANQFGISVFTLRSICYGRHRKHVITPAVL